MKGSKGTFQLIFTTKFLKQKKMIMNENFYLFSLLFPLQQMPPGCGAAEGGGGNSL